MLKDCAIPGCGRQCEGATDYCGTHNREMRKRGEKMVKLIEESKKKRGYQIPKVSEKQAKKNSLYSKQRKEHLNKFPHCQIRLVGCTHIAFEIHHSEGRGENTNKAESFLSACPHCHKILHDKLSAKEARELGLKK